MLSLCGAVSLLLLSATAPVQAATDGQTRYSIESAKAASNLLLDITEAGDRLVVAGDRGHILYSDDGGNSWTQAKVPTRQLLTAIDFVDDKHGWAVGHDALVLSTSDGGQSWQVQYEDREREAPLLDVWFEDTQHGIAVGAYGALIETIDGGQSWDDISDRLENEDGFHLNAIAHIEGSGLFVVGEMGGMFRSADFGDSWEGIELRNGNGHALESGLADGSLLRDGRIAVVGHGGAVLTSDDQGRSFKLVNRPDRRSLSGVTSDSQGNLILVGQGGVRIASPSGADLAPKQ
ncbi:WD40/YVTN/BNR-like repeat-containing protein [Stutzerimonas stutzeri]|uniref:WD40/YVTN/BNR-like repeat-containing protein n=1 Tax=Stutzerimonas stutzeri TaxID=316 RepID=UPI0015E2C671|nr:YCF48-related protein [Stutzerimonas stutzeri]MBA1225642.1 hypothetical protein [Stutzerimonas stutzeri]